jgi:hypothetical protein
MYDIIRKDVERYQKMLLEVLGEIYMDLNKLEEVLGEIFGQQNVKPYPKGFRVIVDYENMPYCVVLNKNDEGKIVLEKDTVDAEEANYEEAYKKAYKVLIQNKDRLDNDVII